MSKYTQGPWHFEPASGGFLDTAVGMEEGPSEAHVFADAGEVLFNADYSDCQDETDVARRDRDVRLASCALAMFEALRGMAMQKKREEIHPDLRDGDYESAHDQFIDLARGMVASVEGLKGEGEVCPTCGGKRVVPDGAHYSGLGKDFGGMYCPTCTREGA